MVPLCPIDPPSYSTTSDSKVAPPPPYVTTEDLEVLELSIAAGMADLTPAQIQDRIMAGLSAEGMDEPLLEDMTKLGGDAWSIDVSFTKIEVLFKDVPIEGFSELWKVDVAGLVTQWRMHRRVRIYPSLSWTVIDGADVVDAPRFCLMI